MIPFKRDIGPVVAVFTVLGLLFSAGPVFGETGKTGGEESYGTLYYICLGSFTVPANAAQYQLELAETGVETITENVRVHGRWFTRVLYRISFHEQLRAQSVLGTLLYNRVIQKNNISDLWVRSSIVALEDDPGFSETASLTGIQVPPQKSTSREITENEAAPKPSGEMISSAGEATETGQTAVTERPAPAEQPAAAPTAEGSGPTRASASEKAQVTAALDGNPYRTIHPEGYANCIFATEPIQLGREDEYDLKDRFVYPEPVYARCYLPGPIGEIEGENFWHEIWVDGKLKGRTFFNEPPEPSWDQIQIWITEDEYSRQMEELGPGEHTMIIWVMKNEFQGERAVADVNAAGDITAEMKEIWVPVRLSKGKFTYVVP